MYYVCEFVVKRRVASTPVIWTFKKKGKQMCYWPVRNVQKKLRKCTPPPLILNSSNWNIFEIKILLNEMMFRTLDLADAKVDRIVDALTASENDSFDTSSQSGKNKEELGAVGGKDSEQKNEIESIVVNQIGEENQRGCNEYGGEQIVTSNGINEEELDVDGKEGKQKDGKDSEQKDDKDTIGVHQIDDSVVNQGEENQIGCNEYGGEQIVISNGINEEEVGDVDGKEVKQKDGKEDKQKDGNDPIGVNQNGGERKATGQGAKNEDELGAVGGKETADNGSIVVNQNGGNEVELQVAGVQWTDILPIDDPDKWKISVGILKDSDKMEELRNKYRGIDETNHKPFINKLIEKTFETDWFCKNIGFRTYKDKIVFDNFDLMRVWIDTLQETCCKNINKIGTRKILVDHCTQYRNTWARSNKKTK